MTVVSPSKAQTNPFPWYSPRFWHGMRFGDWVRLLSMHRFAVHPSRWVLASIVTGFSVGNSVLAGVQGLCYRKSIESTKIQHPPVFIIGHWRSGTTLLHELMAYDDRFCYPTTYECFVPHHHLLSEWFVTRFLRFVLPEKRPMDNMEAGWEHPQEDEFALLSLGVPTVYERIAFPNHAIRFMETLDMSMEKGELEKWRQAIESFAKLLTFQHGKPILFKSPPHTGRIEVLSQLFPEAKFIHIARHPYALFPSSLKLWMSLDQSQALQAPNHQQLEEFVLSAFERMYGGYFAQRSQLASNRLFELRYEDLVQDPLAMLEKIYASLELGSWQEVRSRVERHWASQRGYQVNQHGMDREMEREIHKRWRPYFDAFGYQP